jgi:regulator of RNase E activity RraA
MNELRADTKDILTRVATSTLTGALYKRGFRNMFMQGVSPLRVEQARMVGLAFTMRFIPSREDKNGPGVPRASVQPRAMEECPPGYVLVIDSRGDARAASAGDLYIGRLKARGCAGIVTDGGLRDSEGILKTGLPAYSQRPTSPPSPIVHHPIDLGVVVIPYEIVDEIAAECAATTLYDEFAEEEVARGRPLAGLFPVAGDEAKHDFEAWKAKRAK